MHTPGPWAIAQAFAEHGLTMNDGSIPLMAGDQRVALIDYIGDAPQRKRYRAESPERDANARLIAAAPDMLKALKFVVSFFGDTEAPPCFRARAVIARATGEQDA